MLYILTTTSHDPREPRFCKIRTPNHEKHLQNKDMVDTFATSEDFNGLQYCGIINLERLIALVINVTILFCMSQQ